MLKKLLLVLLACSFGTVGCAKTYDGSNTNPNNNIELTAAEDPDGDGENKGYNYFPMNRPATGSEVFIFDPNYGAWAVYDANGQRVNVGRASGGKLYCPDTG
ncbi:MAG TPA: hypothetical protein VD770_03060, partial [Coxiellaceae bacterium]|nr:hypothetical protein [Coxiellaceae bacterium]